MASGGKKKRCLFGSFGEDLFAVLVAKRFDKVRQTREFTISDRLSVSADIIISDYRNISKILYRCITIWLVTAYLPWQHQECISRGSVHCLLESIFYGYEEGGSGD